MNEKNSIEEIYKVYSKPVWKFVFLMCKNKDVADDVLQETFVKAIKNSNKMGSEKVLSWLFKIAKNTYLDYVRKKDNNNLSVEAEENFKIFDEFDIEKAVIKKIDNINLYANIHKLNETEKEIVFLRIFTDLSFKDIGRIIGKTENYARVIFYRSKVILKGMMENEM